MIVEAQRRAAGRRAAGSRTAATGRPARRCQGEAARATGAEANRLRRGQVSADRGMHGADPGTRRADRGTGRASLGTGGASLGTGGASLGTGGASLGTGSARRATDRAVGATAPAKAAAGSQPDWAIGDRQSGKLVRMVAAADRRRATSGPAGEISLSRTGIARLAARPDGRERAGISGAMTGRPTLQHRAAIVIARAAPRAVRRVMRGPAATVPDRTAGPGPDRPRVGRGAPMSGMAGRTGATGLAGRHVTATRAPVPGKTGAAMTGPRATGSATTGPWVTAPGVIGPKAADTWAPGTRVAGTGIATAGIAQGGIARGGIARGGARGNMATGSAKVFGCPPCLPASPPTSWIRSRAPS